jgi:hypothetical protein
LDGSNNNGRQLHQDYLQNQIVRLTFKCWRRS